MNEQKYNIWWLLYYYDMFDTISVMYVDSPHSVPPLLGGDD